MLSELVKGQIRKYGKYSNKAYALVNANIK